MSLLVNVQDYLPGVHIDLKYATEDNFTGQVVYHFTCCLLIREAATQLRHVQNEVVSLGLQLKIWDGFRPMATQWKFWGILPDERYISDPRKGGRHTRGTAVDLTLITPDGQELLMPSAFDDFSEKAHRDYADCPLEAIKNRQLLQEVMERNGFIGLPTEWWHFDLAGWQSYPQVEIKASSPT